MRPPSWYVLAWALGAAVVVGALALVLARTDAAGALQLLVMMTLVTAGLAWVWHVTRGVGHPALRALAVLAVVAGGGAVGFVVLYATGYVGVALVLAVFAFPLMVSPGASEA